MQSVINSGSTLTVLRHPNGFEPHRIKEAMRERIRADRHRRGPVRRGEAARALATVALEVPEIATARCVAAYASTATAPGTLPLRRALAASGVRVLLPVLLDDGRLDWSVDSESCPPQAVRRTLDEHTAPAALDLLEHEGVASAQAVIVPALAVDTLGNRLGQGSGFYDRALHALDHAVPVFAVVYEDEVLDAAVESVPTEPHDHPVDGVITPHRCLRFSPLWRR